MVNSYLSYRMAQRRILQLQGEVNRMTVELNESRLQLVDLRSEVAAWEAKFEKPVV